jgi:hypothetical protein
MDRAFIQKHSPFTKEHIEAFIAISIADNAPDRVKLFEFLCERLRKGDATPMEQNYIARMLVDNGGTYHKLTLAQRNPGNPDDRRRRNETVWTLAKILHRVGKRRFVSVAVAETGLSEKTVRGYYRGMKTMQFGENFGEKFDANPK